MMLERYLLSKILRFTGWLLLAVVFMVILYLTITYTSMDKHDVPPTLLFKLFGIHFVRYLPRLLAISMFLAILLCYLRLHSERELLAMDTAGFSLSRHLRITLVLAFLSASATAVLTIFMLHNIELRYNDLRGKMKQVWADPDLLQPGKFHSGGRFSIYFGKRDADGAMVNGVYSYIERDEGYLVIVSEAAKLRQSGSGVVLVYESGSVYSIGGDLRSSTDFSSYSLPLDLPQTSHEDYDTWEIPDLIAAGGGAHYAAMHKRLSPIVATMLLPVFALLLVLYGSRWRNSYAIIFIAIIGFFVYYNIIDLAHTALRKDMVPPLLGLVAPHAFLLLPIFILWLAVRSGSYQMKL
ncbi:MAG: LptF/LptG family permease [Candidatus Porifericomitaceae bacterium WSBS_2022_MAG_OTU9]